MSKTLPGISSVWRGRNHLQKPRQSYCPWGRTRGFPCVRFTRCSKARSRLSECWLRLVASPRESSMLTFTSVCIRRPSETMAAPWSTLPRPQKIDMQRLVTCIQWRAYIWDCFAGANEMMRHLGMAVFAMGWLAFAAEPFRDPAPPSVQDLPATKALAPKPNPDVRLHSKPKPLPAGAVTHDWKSFLGPSHNGISTETKLLREWPKGGPPVVWEMRKGTGYSSPAISSDWLVYFHRVDNREKVECLHPETGER